VEGGPLTASRDRALILIGVRGGLRRSELAGIRCEHLLPHARGITITLPKSKTDQEGQGREVEIARGSQPETRRSPNVPARSRRSTSGCARPASSAGRSSTRSTAAKTCKRLP
jgi:integrase